jgi:hypothetical protein
MNQNELRREKSLPEVAFYYPGPSWHSGDWIKNLILFFDGVGLLVPNYMRDSSFRIDPAIAAGLEEHKLLYQLAPETFVDRAATEQLATALTDLLTSGALDQLAVEPIEFQNISRGRMGYDGDPDLAAMIFFELESKGLAQASIDGLSIPVHPVVRTLILVLLAQILRPYGSLVGIELSPVTDRPELVEALRELLGIPTASSAGHVVAFDLATVSVDLGNVPFDEVLDFRRHHLEEHRRYIRSIRQFARELSLMPEEERAKAFDDRQTELDDLAHDLKRNSRTAWKRPATFSLSLAGAAWTLATGDPIGALIAAGGSALGGLGSSGATAGAYSYLFRAQRRFGDATPGVYRPSYR